MWRRDKEDWLLTCCCCHCFGHGNNSLNTSRSGSDAVVVVENLSRVDSFTVEASCLIWQAPLTPDGTRGRRTTLETTAVALPRIILEVELLQVTGGAPAAAAAAADMKRSIAAGIWRGTREARRRGPRKTILGDNNKSSDSWRFGEKEVVQGVTTTATGFAMPNQSCCSCCWLLLLLPSFVKDRCSNPYRAGTTWRSCCCCCCHHRIYQHSIWTTHGTYSLQPQQQKDCCQELHAIPTKHKPKSLSLLQNPKRNSSSSSSSLSPSLSQQET